MKDRNTTSLQREWDAQLRRAIQRALAQRPGFDATAISVRVDDRAVVLAGTVFTWEQRIAAVQLAHHVPGVLDVADELVVRSAPKAKSDLALAKDVRSRLDRTGIDVRSIHTTVSDGWVTLEGYVATDGERTGAVAALSELPGVQGVREVLALRSERRPPGSHLHEPPTPEAAHARG